MVEPPRGVPWRGGPAGAVSSGRRLESPRTTRTSIRVNPPHMSAAIFSIASDMDHAVQANQRIGMVRFRNGRYRLIAAKRALGAKREPSRQAIEGDGSAPISAPNACPETFQLVFRASQSPVSAKRNPLPRLTCSVNTVPWLCRTTLNTNRSSSCNLEGLIMALGVLHYAPTMSTKRDALVASLY